MDGKYICVESGDCDNGKFCDKLAQYPEGSEEGICQLCPQQQMDCIDYSQDCNNCFQLGTTICFQIQHLIYYVEHLV